MTISTLIILNLHHHSMSKHKFAYSPPQLLTVSLLLAFCLASNAWAGYIQLDSVADIKTRFSAGCSSVQELANLARHRNIDAIIFSDSDRRALEYGIIPFEKIFKKKKEQPSILTSGAASYLAEINNTDQGFNDVILLPAVESAPFYYWSGNLAGKNLTANHIDKHLLLVGLERSEDYEQLPILNSNFSKKYLNLYLKPFLIYAGGVLVFLVLYIKSPVRKTAFSMMILSTLLAINNQPFKSSRFDAYHGDPGIAPFQEVIDYANYKGALTFWNHLEMEDSTGKVGAMGFKTLPHPEDLVLSKNYTGFQAVYDGKSHTVDPGKEWDQTLMDYVSGDRKQPVWGYGGNDFHCEGDNGHVFGGVRTILLVRKKSRKDVMEALRAGRMYPVKQSGAQRLSLDDFSLSDKTSGQSATHGESLSTAASPELKINLRSTGGLESTVILSIVRNGKLIRREEASLPYELNWQDEEVERKGQAYYRIMAETGPEDYLVSNPIFVNFISKSVDVASLPPESKNLPLAPKPPSEKAPLPPQSPKSPKEPEVKVRNVQPRTKKTDKIKLIETKSKEKNEQSIELGSPKKEKKREINVPEPSAAPKYPTTPDFPEVAKKPQLVTPSVASLLKESEQEIPSATLSTASTKQTETKTPEVPLAKLNKTSPSSISAPVQPTIEKKPFLPTRPPTPSKRYVIALIDGITLKKGPGISFPEVMTAIKGERLEFIRGMNKTFSDKPWLEVKKLGKTVYVWGGLVQPVNPDRE
tara:strand:- start:579 stop:2840 length:2262 start_codon:yes stop_codon:yes gene_type:complete